MKKEIKWETVEEAIRRDIEAKPNRKKENHVKKLKASDIAHPVLSEEVTIETRTSSGIKVHTSIRQKSFHHTAGAITQHCVGCSPDLKRKIDSFYGRIDRDLAEYELQRDYKLGCNYAVRRVLKERKHERAIRLRLKRDAIKRGLV